MKVTEKAFGKINFALNVGEKVGEYHELETLVSTVNLFDKVILYSRKDKKVTLKAAGSVKEYVYNCNPLKDNAYKAAVAFMEKFSTNGVDIVVEKHIPLSSGMGGSSACISAVLRGMKRLYDIDDDLSELANSLGSDTNFLLKGGCAILRGRGDKVEYLDELPAMKFVAVFPAGGVDVRECFDTFDRLKGGENVENSEKADIEGLAGSLYTDKIKFEECKNMLEKSACNLNGEVKRALDFVRSLSPKATFMTGSGSAVCAFFDYDGLCFWAQEKLAKEGFLTMCLETV